MNHAENNPLRIRKVIITGNNRTRSQVFNDELQDAYEATSFGQVRERLEVAAIELSQLGIFDSVDITLNAVKDSTQETDITISVKEKNWWKLNVGATTDGYEGSLESSCSLVNPLGTGETIVASASRGYIGSGITRASYRKPRFLGLEWLYTMSVADEIHNNEHLSSYNEKFRGGSMGLKSYSGLHDLEVMCGWRDVVPRRHSKIPTAYNASSSIIAEAVPSMKTSLKYTYEKDSRNDSLLPSSGNLFNLSTEIAGLFGDVQFLKVESNLQKHVSFGPKLLKNPLFGLSMSSKIGAIKGYGSDQDRVARISDRFFLGGPLTLRGFGYKGVGPHADPKSGGHPRGDSLGGEVMYNVSSALHFPFPIPLLAVMGFRGMFFVNGGNVMNWSDISAMSPSASTSNGMGFLSQLMKDTRVSTGIGMVLGTRIGRIEATYSWILNSKSTDAIRHGQLGLGISFS